MDNRVQLTEQAAELLGRDTRPVLNRLVECSGGDWYLREKIVKAPNADSVLDNSRPLKYAAHFEANGAKVTFVREGAEPTPDLLVAVEGLSFYVEVRKFKMDEGEGSSDPVMKIVNAIAEKRRQLPRSEIGFVAVDNFDLRLERGFRHDHIEAALSEIERRARCNPNGWRQPSGVIVSAASVIGSVPVKPPHFHWANRDAECPAPERLAQWLLDSLPNSRLFQPDGDHP